MFVFCSKCKRSIDYEVSRSLVSQCCVCKKYFHKLCVTHSYTGTISPWTCEDCYVNLPFNHLTDDVFRDVIQGSRSMNQGADLLSQSLSSLYETFTIDSSNYYDIDSFNKLALGDFSLFHLNSRSLRKNLDSISNLLSILDHTFSVLGFTETWLSDCMPPLIQFNNYKMVECHRNNKKGGGVCLYIHEELEFTVRPDISPFNDIIESLFVELTIPQKSGRNRNVIVGVVYRPPQSSLRDFNDCIDKILNLISSESKPCHIMGDFNIDLLKDNANEFLSNIVSNSFEPTITKPTHVNERSASLIDNIFSNTVDNHCVSGILITDITDHFPIFLSVDISKHNNDSGYYSRNYSTRNIDNFVISCRNFNWDFICSDNDVAMAFSRFNSIFRDIYDTCFPLSYITKRKRRKKRHPWISSGILQSIKYKNKLYKMYLKNPTPDKLSHLRTYRNKLNHILRIFKKHHFSDKFYNCKYNMKRTWAVVNEVLQKGSNKSSYPSSFKHNNGVTSDPNVIANGFNIFSPILVLPYHLV